MIIPLSFQTDRQYNKKILLYFYSKQFSILLSETTYVFHSWELIQSKIDYFTCCFLSWINTFHFSVKPEICIFYFYLNIATAVLMKSNKISHTKQCNLSSKCNCCYVKLRFISLRMWNTQVILRIHILILPCQEEKTNYYLNIFVIFLPCLSAIHIYRTNITCLCHSKIWFLHAINKKWKNMSIMSWFVKHWWWRGSLVYIQDITAGDS
jgi:hypothetical protein